VNTLPDPESDSVVIVPDEYEVSISDPTQPVMESHNHLVLVSLPPSGPAAVHGMSQPGHSVSQHPTAANKRQAQAQ
jgi:hypothetical protein